MSRISTEVKLLDQRFGFEKTTARSRKLLSKKRASSSPLPLIPTTELSGYHDY